VKTRSLFLLSGLVAFVVLPETSRAAEADMASHRIVYDLSLEQVRGSDIVSASGTMTYQTQRTCAGWSVQQRLVLTTASRDGGSSDTKSEYATLESLDGRKFVFDTRQSGQDGVVTEFKGDAALDPDGGGTITYALPSAQHMKMPVGTLFPMHHTAAILEAAAAGHGDLSPSLFDGTGADGALSTYVLISGRQPEATDAPVAAMRTMPSWQVHVAYFTKKRDAMLPDFESDQRYFANGVADRIHLDFGDFRMSGTVHEFRLLPAPKQRCAP